MQNLKIYLFFVEFVSMNAESMKKLIQPNSTNPVKAVREIVRLLRKSELDKIELDLSAMNLIDAVKVLVLTSSFLCENSPDEKLKFRFVSADIENLLSSFSLTNLEFVLA